MAEHKAPTQVSVAPTSEASPFQEWIQNNWPKLAGVAVVVAAIILGRQYMALQAVEKRDAAWSDLADPIDASMGFVQLADAEELASLADAKEDQISGPWVRAMEISKRIEERDYHGAKAALDRLAADFPDHELLTQTFRFTEEGEPQKLYDFLATRLGELQAWDKAHPNLFENPPLPEGSPRVRLTTAAGPIVVGLYEEKAPEHVANFLKLCSEGFYDGTKFHRVMSNFMIQGGDPNTREEDTSTWGQGGPDYKIEPEITDLYHFEGVLAAAKMPGDTESSGSQFYITTGAPHWLDGQHTVFGVLLEGQDTVDAIESGTIAEGDRPENPIEILSTEVL